MTADLKKTAIMMIISKEFYALWGKKFHSTVQSHFIFQTYRITFLSSEWDSVEEMDCLNYSKLPPKLLKRRVLFRRYPVPLARVGSAFQVTFDALISKHGAQLSIAKVPMVSLAPARPLVR